MALCHKGVKVNQFEPEIEPAILSVYFPGGVQMTGRRFASLCETACAPLRQCGA